jgi:hypothetical protein
MRKILITLAAGAVIGLGPMFAEQAEAQRFGRGGGFGRIGIGGGIGRVGWGGGIGRVGIGRVGWGGGIGRVGWGGPRLAGVGWGGRGWGVRPGWGVRRAAWWGGYPGWGVRRAAWWGGYPGWRVRRAAWWGAPLAVGIGVGLAYRSCYRWDPYYGYVNVCYAPYGGYYAGYW